LDFIISKNFPFYFTRSFILVKNTNFLTNHRRRKKKEGEEDEDEDVDEDEDEDDE
jgi:hypothetical protein